MMSFATQILGLALATAPLTQTIDTPESAYFDAKTQQLYVSSVAGNPGEKDGRGWISAVTFDKDGKPSAHKIVEGLNAPKGIAVRNGILWVADVDRVVRVELASKRQLAPIAVPGSVFLNDVAIGPNGAVYVSDTIASRIYVIEKEKPRVFADGRDLEGPNGLLVADGKLYVASWGFITDPATFGVQQPGRLYALDLRTKARTDITPKPFGNLDGLTRAPNGDFIVTDYVAGKMFRINAAGEATLLAEGLKNPADVGRYQDHLLLPEMGANKISFPKL